MQFSSERRKTKNEYIKSYRRYSIMIFKPLIDMETRKTFFRAASGILVLITVMYYQVLGVLSATIRRNISLQTRKKCAGVAKQIFTVIFTYYRLSRMLLLLILEFTSRKMMKILKQKQDEHSSCKWPKELPEEIMQLFLQQRGLCTSDYFNCRAVSPSWQASVDIGIASRRLALTQIPLLMLRSHHFSLIDDCCLRLGDRKIYKSNPTSYNMSRLECVGSIEGWLVMVDNAFLHPEDFMKPWSFYLPDEQAFHTVNFILNPVSGARVSLPSQSTIPCTSNSSPFFFTKVVASAVPTSQHCVVAGLCSFDKSLVFCRPTDKSWTLIEVEGEGLLFHDIEIIDGKLYASTRNASEFLMVFDIQGACNGCNPPSPPKAETLVMLHPWPILHNMVTSDGAIRKEKCDNVYLLRDSTSKELFMIYCRSSTATELDPIIPWSVIIGPNAPTPMQIEGFRVFKLEHKNGPRWVEIFDLGNRIVFLSNTNSIIIHALDCDHLPLERNCIYFAFESFCFVSPSNGYEAAVFSLTNSTIRRNIFPQDQKRTRLNRRCIWFAPNIVC